MYSFETGDYSVSNKFQSKLFVNKRLFRQIDLTVTDQTVFIAKVKFEGISWIDSCDGEPGVEGPGAGAAVGAGEHRGVRGRPGERHAIWGDLRGHAGSATPPLTGHTTPV